MASTSAEDTIPKMEKIMATHGLIGELKTDNGPPFTSHEWANYFRSHSTKHRKITPRWPQANGEAERFMRTLTKVIRIAHAGGQNLESVIFSFLREYSLTPHSTTGIAPSYACFKRRVGDVIPHHPTCEEAQLPHSLTDARRTKQNERTSQSRRAKPKSLAVGDLLVRDRHPGSKFRLTFEPHTWRVTAVKAP